MENIVLSIEVDKDTSSNLYVARIRLNNAKPGVAGEELMADGTKPIIAVRRLFEMLKEYIERGMITQLDELNTK